MKLYTEEQLTKAMILARHTYDTKDEILKKLTPIELPSDEEQEKFVHPRSDEYAAGFFRAMEMIEEQILEQNK